MVTGIYLYLSTQSLNSMQSGLQIVNLRIGNSYQPQIAYSGKPRVLLLIAAIRERKKARPDLIFLLLVKPQARQPKRWIPGRLRC